MSSGPLDDDLNGMVKDDVEKFQQMRRNDGMDTSIPALFELTFGGLTALVAIAWFASLFVLPESVESTTWMGLGAIGLLTFGGPTALIYWLRRGGVETFNRLLRNFMG